MAIRFYDEAVAEKINSWLPKSGKNKIQVLKPDETKKMFSIEADANDDKPLKLPLVALSRNTSINILQKTMTPMSYDGLTLRNVDNNKTLKLRGIPITLDYQLDIYTRRYDEGDELLREFVFKLMNNPQVVIELPYNNEKFRHVSTIHLAGQIEDTSAISERLFSGQFTRWTLNFGIEGAYFFSLPYVDNVYIEYSEAQVESDVQLSTEKVMLNYKIDNLN